MAKRRKNKICLSMIVKNEANVIARSIESAKPYIDCWAISDTGSTDGTQDIIRNLLKDIPGKLIERPWKNFAHNRNETLDLARKQKAEYILTLDADDILVVEPNTLTKESLVSGGYQLQIEFGELNYNRTALVRSDLPWRWIGVVHEVLVCDQQTMVDSLPGWNIKCFNDGCRRTNDSKYLQDIELLEQSRKEDPNNTRTVFYLAQSYRDAGNIERALSIYQDRISMGGWDEEVYYSILQVARIFEWLGKWSDALAAYMDAYDTRPSRVEPLYFVAKHYREANQFNTAITFAEKTISIKQPNDILFVEGSIYKWRALDEFAVDAYWVGRYSDALQANKNLLINKYLPDHQRPRIQKNLEFCIQKTT